MSSHPHFLPAINRARHPLSRGRAVVLILLMVVTSILGANQKASGQTNPSQFTWSEGGIIRGLTDQKRIALAFTAHSFAEGGDTILDALNQHHGKASFFVTGDFIADTNHAPILKRILTEGHYLGPHSDKHLLYCPWDGPKKTLISKEEFDTDLKANLEKIQHVKSTLGYRNVAHTRLSHLTDYEVKYWLPAFEWYNQDISDWSKAMGMTLVNFTPGTRSNADYMQDDDPHFIPSKSIYQSILDREQKDSHGLNGFILLMHLGVGPGRTDKMSAQFPALLDELSKRGYQFVRIDELLSVDRLPK